LPGGIKTSPVANCDNEETGLFTFDLLNPIGKAFSIDVPALKPSTLLSNQIDIDQADSDVAALISELLSSEFNNLWSSQFDSVRAARKTFRKHRRAAARR
jgi:hypothetical protein